MQTTQSPCPELYMALQAENVQLKTQNHLLKQHLSHLAIVTDPCTPPTAPRRPQAPDSLLQESDFLIYREEPNIGDQTSQQLDQRTFKKYIASKDTTIDRFEPRYITLQIQGMIAKWCEHIDKLPEDQHAHPWGVSLKEAVKRDLKDFPPLLNNISSNDFKEISVKDWEDWQHKFLSNYFYFNDKITGRQEYALPDPKQCRRFVNLLKLCYTIKLYGPNSIFDIKTVRY